MSETSTLSLSARISIAALFVLGLLGGTLIVAYSGYETSPRRGETPVFVPAPEAYAIAVARRPQGQTRFNLNLLGASE
ncbi:MAG: hypothetical protein DID92_2727744306 [Candidatus Nitrotoga sp. SPKER]|nr:MAG: hypothetical protein DID92_2727744306 [Candidatus Nitrotoga sp. SPKER]